MKTTIELPDDLLRQAKATAALEGISMRKLFTDALAGKIRNVPTPSSPKSPPWMKGFGALADLTQETARIQRLIDAEFEQIESDDIR